MREMKLRQIKIDKEEEWWKRNYEKCVCWNKELMKKYERERREEINEGKKEKKNDEGCEEKKREEWVWRV